MPEAETAVAIPLDRLDSLPEGAQFASRSGRVTVEARRRGGELVITARSDSLMRRVLRLERLENRSGESAETLRRSLEERSTDSLERVAALSTARTEERQSHRSRPALRGWWFAAGAVAGVALLTVRRRKRSTGGWC